MLNTLVMLRPSTVVLVISRYIEYIIYRPRDYMFVLESEYTSAGDVREEIYEVWRLPVLDDTTAYVF